VLFAALFWPEEQNEEQPASIADIGIQWCSAKIISGPVPHSSAQLSSDSDY
jgi:hypothetical protein